MTFFMDLAKSSTSLTLHNTPHFSSIYSSGPKHLVDITGIPLAKASIPGIANDSISLLITKAFSCSSILLISCFVFRPKKLTYLLKFNLLHSSL